MRVILSGGGTGGHIYPALSTAEALRPHVTELLYIGSVTGPEREIVPQAGWKFVGLPADPLRRSVGGVIRAANSVSMGWVKAARIMARFQPDVVIVTGGYAAAAAGIAAGILRIPLVLESPDAVPGRVTRLLSPFASLITTAIPGPERRLSHGKTVCTGFPIRPEITRGSAEAARERWGLEPGRPVVLVYGGSQGAQTLNRATVAALPLWLGAGSQVLHSVGRKLFDGWESDTEAWHKKGYRPVPYIDGMADAYAVADLVVCRGGASSIAEATACGKPMVILPYPHHADRHQIVNAQVMERAGAALMVENRDAVALLPGRVQSLMADPQRRGAMSAASRAMGHLDAADAVAREVLGLLDPSPVPSP